MSDRREGAGQVLAELPDQGARDWTVVRALLAANDATSRALELHLLHTEYRDESESPVEETTRYLDDAIRQHEEIIEDLRLARAALNHR